MLTATAGWPVGAAHGQPRTAAATAAAATAAAVTAATQLHSHTQCITPDLLQLRANQPVSNLQPTLLRLARPPSSSTVCINPPTTSLHPISTLDHSPHQNGSHHPPISKPTCLKTHASKPTLLKTSTI
ncbi:hypothetical protein PCASD_03239 [Puccinia coronata f. sp. avenae]|uniref:Uncharacterized protein n=1 Tax=Puccinia coronata f. sp. avenae TaxID=200324 RepID=A0A2N5VFM0_9BASI|nr:hypothetical protein PCASD_03239 [Puccinia coronata f. sp. avenae]